MYDKELVTDILKNIAWSFEQITIRFQAIKTSDAFIKDDIGFEKLDSICMQLINVGEALKQVDKLTNGKLLVTYPGVDWKRAKGMRDVIVHHYFDIDHETVYVVCKEHIPVMKEVLRRVLSDLEGT